MVARTAATKKAKGTRLEKKVAERYRYWRIDKDAKRMPLSGAISYLKGDIYKPNDKEWVDECKSHETVRLGLFWRQSVQQAPSIWQHPALHVSANFRPIVTLIRECDFDDLIEGDDRAFYREDITSKKRWNFWEWASRVQNTGFQATVIDVIVNDEALVMMDIETYMKLRAATIA